MTVYYAFKQAEAVHGQLCLSSSRTFHGPGRPCSPGLLGAGFAVYWHLADSERRA